MGFFEWKGIRASFRGGPPFNERLRLPACPNLRKCPEKAGQKEGTHPKMVIPGFPRTWLVFGMTLAS